VFPQGLKIIGIVIAAALMAPCLENPILAGEGIPQEAPRDEKPAFRDQVLGGFRLQKDGVGFMILDGCLLVEVLTVSSGNVIPGIFLLDMDSDRPCTLDEAFAEKLSLGEEKTIGLKFGQKESIDDLPVIVEKQNLLHKFSKRNASVLQARTVSGVIGFGVFQGRKIVIDFAEYRLRFISADPQKGDEAEDGSEKTKTPPSPWEVDYAMAPAPFCCSVRINDKGPFFFQLNTACAQSWVKKSVASQAAWRRGKKPHSFLLAGLDMTAIPVQFEFKNFKPADKIPVIDGVLGNDFLSRFAVTVDTAARRVLFTAVD